MFEARKEILWQLSEGFLHSIVRLSQTLFSLSYLLQTGAEKRILILKVRQSLMIFFKPKFLPRHNWTNSTLLLWSLRLTCFRLFWKKLKTAKRHYKISWHYFVEYIFFCISRYLFNFFRVFMKFFTICQWNEFVKRFDWWKCNSFHWFLKPFNEKKKRENSEFEIFFCSEMDIDCIACNWQNHEIILKLLWPRLTAISWKMVALLVHFFSTMKQEERNVMWKLQVQQSSPIFTFTCQDL